MDELFLHDSRQKKYRSLFGAAPTGARVTLRLAVFWPEVQEAVLRLWQEDDTGGKEIILPMTREGTSEFYAAEVQMPEKGCLLWYYFIIKGSEETLYYGNNAGNWGGVGSTSKQAPASFQITVYDRASVTPDWFKHSVVYQIFPDRFYRSEHGQAVTSGKPNAVMHEQWEEVPAYIKDDQGRVLKYDFSGGNLAGIMEKLPYLQDLGINVLYLNPIFLSASNHRYDTGDYKQIDPYLGTKEEFVELCRQAKSRGIRVILDGVFSHTGDDSIYFNRYGRFPGVGAYQSQSSPYYPWYKFQEYPDKYESWWGVGTLPEVEENTPSYMEYIFGSEDSVLQTWLEAGISGWRLDVADELPPLFLKSFWQALKKANPDALLLGEVWEDASNKISYGQQRAYLSGGQLDSVMNYVLRDIMLAYVLGKADAYHTEQRILSQRENYPLENFYAMLNLVGSHDVERVLTLLSGDGAELGCKRLHLLWIWQLTMPGAPCIYYGDEAGVEGGKDPDNRRTYPWGRENKTLQNWCKQLIHLRREHTVLRTGRYIPLWVEDQCMVYGRAIEGGLDVFGKPAEDGLFIIALNSGAESKTLTIRTDGFAYGTLIDVLGSEQEITVSGGDFTLTIPAMSGMVLTPKQENMPRRAGILLHPTSLPSYGKEGITEDAKDFIDFLAEAGQKLWQVLPLVPTGEGDSPYFSFSAFGGNPKFFPGAKRLQPQSEDYMQFCQKHSYWLDDYALYKSLKNKFKQKPWWQWPNALSKHDSRAVAKYTKLLEKEINKYKAEQYNFFTKWQEIKDYAHSKQVKILGDMPIFVAHDSADCWAHQQFFLLDKKCQPLSVAGVPPDYFSAKGQIWGNPLYNWETLAADDFNWWVQRFATVAELVDEVRIDHFRGFAACWAIPQGSEDGTTGKWTPGPGAELFKVVEQKLPELELVAEDLGVITQDVADLKNQLGLPGMKVMEFMLKDRGGVLAFDTEVNCLAYTGTHDNNTLVGWYKEELKPQEQLGVRQMLELEEDFTERELCEKALAYLYSRRAATAIVPMQDVLALPAACRMNIPGTATGNWQWRLTAAELKQAPASFLRQLTKKYKR